MKRIGITTNKKIVADDPVDGWTVNEVHCDYGNSVELVGGVPLLLPVTTNPKTINAYLDCIDGLILSGGVDIHSFHFGEEMKPLCGKVNNERDTFEIKLTKLAIDKGIPILGICRGMQLINVIYGGTLYQDLSYYENNSLKHRNVGDASIPVHYVEILDKNSISFKIWKRESIEVNSIHHQVIDIIGDGLKVVGQSSDGVVEILEDPDYPFLLAVQFHPELMASKGNLDMTKLFKAFVDAVK
ncbi:MAG: gamma-glutamyl-gamma-aminobutyrate hydrolase family protein [Bacteroidales bacterium]